MKLWLFSCLIACFVEVWIPTVHTQGTFEDCCLGYQSKAKWSILQHARYYQHQEVSGSCNLRAVIFYFPEKGKMVCVKPWDKDVRKAMKILNARIKRRHNPQKLSQASQAEKKMLNHGKSKVKNSNSSSGMRNAYPSHSSLQHH
uniref:C-C motif chemokine 25 n=1 Tax=Jaculus jaculus TaxID=51337 RepID=UPI001E1B37BA|nr:C-C motif chemokine 25 [Jaculus jaculus]